MLIDVLYTTLFFICLP